MHSEEARLDGGDGGARPDGAPDQGDLIERATAELERRVGTGQATKIVEATTGVYRLGRMAAWQDRPWEAVDKATGEVLWLIEPPPPHEAAEVFPLATDEEVADLAADIGRQGLLEPLVLCDGKLLDGRNRLRACERAGVAPRFEVWSGNPFALAWSLNGERRDLNATVKFLCFRRCEEGARAIEEARAEAAERASAARAKAADERRAEDGTLTSLASSGGETGRDYAAEQARKTAEVVAGKLGISRAAVERAQRIARSDYESPVRTGAMKPTEALRKIKKAEVRAKVAALPEGKFRVIYADPPWQYNDARQTGDHRESTGALHHYSTMTIAELTALDVKSLAADDSVLFLWATFPLLAEGLAVLRGWGFAHKTAFVWDKQRSNFGSYHDARAELLLIGTRGSCTPDVDRREPQVQAYPRGRHSEKPAEWRLMIDQLYPHGPRIELFRRGDAPSGWRVWGAEAAEALA